MDEPASNSPQGTTAQAPSVILFCTDFSDNARKAFAYAVDAAAHRPGSTLHLLHVLPEPDAQFWKPYIYELDHDVDQKARDTFDHQVATEYVPHIPDGVRFQATFRIGKAASEIIRYAKEIHATFLVLGRQGRGAIHSFFFGTTAEKVVRDAQCPVLVIPLQPDHLQE